LHEVLPRRKSAAGLLESLGHVVFDLRGTEREGSRDADIFHEAQQHGAIFLTTDRDFFHTIPHHAGVIVIALRQPNRAAILEKLSWILNRLRPEQFARRTIQLRDQTWTAIPALESGT
jgi:predicted nuclease of predicted toxin-antitoxin system